MLKELSDLLGDHSSEYEDVCKILTKYKVISKPVETTNEQPKNGIYYDGEFLEMEYEELVDLFATFRDKGEFKFCNLTKEKASKVFGSLLPMTSY